MIEDMHSKNLIVAIDTTDFSRASALVAAVRSHCGMIKFGLEFCLTHPIRDRRDDDDLQVCLDLKLHDIPETVFRVVKSVLRSGPAMITVHAEGGEAMVRAAKKAAQECEHPPKIAAVIRISSRPPAPRVSLTNARAAVAGGADALIGSPLEFDDIHGEFTDIPIITPGVRRTGGRIDDHDPWRVLTPQQAFEAGSAAIIVGRPITEAKDPAQAIRAFFL